MTVHVGHPKVRPHVAPLSNTIGRAKEDIITSFIVVWQPVPTPPPLWIRFLQEAPFGTQLVRSQDLRWDGKFLSIELMDEAGIEAYAAEMPQWVENAVASVPGVGQVSVKLTFDPPWDQGRMSDEARLALNMF